MRLYFVRLCLYFNKTFRKCSDHIKHAHVEQIIIIKDLAIYAALTGAQCVFLTWITAVGASPRVGVVYQDEYVCCILRYVAAELQSDTRQEQSS